jgi:hypothetical protein
MHDTQPRRYCLRSASRSSMEVPRTPRPNRQNRSSLLRPMRVLRNSSVVQGRAEVVSPTPAARAYAIRFHQTGRKVAALVLSDKDNISQISQVYHLQNLLSPPGLARLSISSNKGSEIAAKEFSSGTPYRNWRTRGQSYWKCAAQGASSYSMATRTPASLWSNLTNGLSSIFARGIVAVFE